MLVLRTNKKRQKLRGRTFFSAILHCIDKYVIDLYIISLKQVLTRRNIFFENSFLVQIVAFTDHLQLIVDNSVNQFSVIIPIRKSTSTLDARASFLDRHPISLYIGGCECDERFYKFTHVDTHVNIS